MDIWSYLLLGLIFLGELANILLTGYFSKKGKNLADKQDIEEITNKVEEVKKKFLGEIEQLRAELNVSSSIKLEYKKAERAGVTDFHNKLLTWLHDINTEDNEDAHGKLTEQAAKLRVRKRNTLLSFQEFSKAYHTLLFLVADLK